MSEQEEVGVVGSLHPSLSWEEQTCKDSVVNMARRRKNQRIMYTIMVQ